MAIGSPTGPKGVDDSGLSPESAEGILSELASRLRARRSEIEEALLTRVTAVADLGDVDPSYIESLRISGASAFDFFVGAIEGGEGMPQLPEGLLAQARMAARTGIGLDTVLRRCLAGRFVLGEFLIEEVEKSGLDGADLRPLVRLQRTQAGFFDRLLAAVTTEYTREAQKRPVSSEQRRAERIERLLAGEEADTSSLAYDFEGHHLGVIVSGPDPSHPLRELAAAVDCLLLSVSPLQGTTWAWFGGRRPTNPADLMPALSASWPAQLSMAIGESGEGLMGWRLTHRQARAALPMAMRNPEPVVRYADVALLASMLPDDLLTTSLRQLYLEPLEQERDGGKVARETLRAYFAAERNVSSAAAALGVSRRTVANRLQVIEARLGRQLGVVGAEIEAALRLDSLSGSSPAAAEAPNS